MSRGRTAAQMAEVRANVDLTAYRIGSSEPRRRYAVCPHLAIDGEPATEDNSRQYKLKGWHIDRSGQVFTCRLQPGTEQAGCWVADLCLSSWHRDCAFLPEPETASERPMTVATFAVGYQPRRTEVAA